MFDQHVFIAFYDQKKNKLFLSSTNAQFCHKDVARLIDESIKHCNTNPCVTVYDDVYDREEGLPLYLRPDKVEENSFEQNEKKYYKKRTLKLNKKKKKIRPTLKDETVNNRSQSHSVTETESCDSQESKNDDDEASEVEKQQETLTNDNGPMHYLIDVEISRLTPKQASSFVPHNQYRTAVKRQKMAELTSCANIITPQTFVSSSMINQDPGQQQITM